LDKSCKNNCCRKSLLNKIVDKIYEGENKYNATLDYLSQTNENKSSQLIKPALKPKIKYINIKSNIT